MESAISGPGDWRDNAACRDADPDLFFPIGTTAPALRQVWEAIRICQACPIQVRCLAWALEQGVTDGVWAGPPPVWAQLHSPAVAPEAAGCVSRPVSG